MKKLTVLALALAMIFTLAACKKSDEPKDDTGSDNTYTGVVQEVKDGMLIVGASMDSGDAYVFGIDKATSAVAGDKVTITFEGDIKELGSTLTATNVEIKK